ncbi:MAG: cell division protein FtsX [Bacteroidota bacterium]|jgi:cell division transport system permease protein
MPEKSSKLSLRASSITVVISLSLVLFMLGLAGWAMLNFRNLSNTLKEEFGFQILLNEKAGQEKMDLLLQQLSASGFVKKAEFKSKDVAAQEMKEQLGEDFISFLGENPLDPAINVKLNSSYVNNDSLSWIKSKILTMAGGKVVKEINYHKLLFDEMDKNGRDISLVLLVLAALLSVVAIGLIHFTIRLSIYSKRFLLKTMYLVGATRGFIRRPFIVRGIKQGFFAGILACIFMGGFIYLIIRLFPMMSANQNPVHVILLMAGIVLSGIFISSLSAAVAVGRYLRLKPGDMYL